MRSTAGQRSTEVRLNAKRLQRCEPCVLASSTTILVHKTRNQTIRLQFPITTMRFAHALVVLAGCDAIAPTTAFNTNLRRPPASRTASRNLQAEEICNVQGGTNCESSIRSCNGFDIEFCNMNCIDACHQTIFRESNVTCQDYDSCQLASFRESEVYCKLSSYGQDSCDQAKFYNSAIHCGAGSNNYACDEADFWHCNCCLDSSNCPSGVPLCVSPETGSSVEFCSSTFLGQSCSKWGNPICDAVEVQEQSPLHPAAACSVSQDIVTCDSTVQSCADYGTVDSCTVNCIDSCGGVNF